MEFIMTVMFGFVDSVGKPVGIETNLYGYTMQDPVNLIDPKGLTPQFDDEDNRPLFPVLSFLFSFFNDKPNDGSGNSGNGSSQCPGSIPSDDECWERCKHLLPSPSGDLQSSEFRKCWRKCKGTL